MGYTFNPLTGQLTATPKRPVETSSSISVHVSEFGIINDPARALDQTPQFKALGDWGREQEAVEIHFHADGVYKTGLIDVLNIPYVRLIGNGSRFYTTLDATSRTNFIGFTIPIDIPFISNARSPNNLGGVFGEAYKSEYFQTVVAGSYTITLTVPAEAADYKPGDRCILYGKETQANFGYPPNKLFFEWKEVKTANSQTGVITFTERLKHSYDSRWHGGVMCFRYQTLPYRALSMENRFAGTPYQWRFSTYKETDYLYIENLTCDVAWVSGRSVTLKNVNVLDYFNITTLREITIDGGIYRDIEVDKLVDRVSIRNAKVSRLTSATGCNYLEVTCCDFEAEPGSIIANGIYGMNVCPRHFVFKNNRVWGNYNISLNGGWIVYLLEFSYNLFYKIDDSDNFDKFLFTPAFTLPITSARRNVTVQSVSSIPSGGKTAFTFDAQEESNAVQPNPLLKQYTSHLVNNWYPGMVLRGTNAGQKFIVSNVYRDSSGLSYCEGRTTFPLTTGTVLTFHGMFNQVTCAKNIIVGAQQDNQLTTIQETFPVGDLYALSFTVDTADYNNKNIYTQVSGRVYGYRILVRKAAGAAAGAAPMRLYFQNLSFTSYSKQIVINGKTTGMREVLFDRVSGAQAGDTLPIYSGEQFEQIRLQLFGDVHTTAPNDPPVIEVTLLVLPSQLNFSSPTPS